MTTVLEDIDKKWAAEITKDNIEKEIDKLHNDFDRLIDNILASSVSQKIINDTYTELRQKLLFLKLSYERLYVENEEKIKEKLDRLSNIIDTIAKYEARESQHHQKKSLSLLAYISIIVLPLTLITSYFGMNFYSMGAPASHGILYFEWGQLLVFVMGVISLIVAIAFINHYYTVAL